MATLKIPLTSEPWTTFSIDLDNANYKCSTVWNETDQAWYFDIKGLDADSTIELYGIKLVGGIDLLEPFAARELGQLYIVDGEGKNQDPDRELLGDRYLLLYVEK